LESGSCLNETTDVNLHPGGRRKTLEDILSEVLGGEIAVLE
jgi:hypothetical protein